MNRIATPGWAALLAVLRNLALGMAPFVFLAWMHPGAAATSTGLWLAVCLLVLMLRFRGQMPGFQSASAFRLLLSCLLLGSSLAAIPWQAQESRIFPVAAGVGFTCRWWLYLIESRDLAEADRRRLALPCFATRIRRSLTWVTGAIIPLLLLSGLPGLPLLVLSFGLTALGQWIQASELILRELQAKQKI